MAAEASDIGRRGEETCDRPAAPMPAEPPSLTLLSAMSASLPTMLHRTDNLELQLVAVKRATAMDVRAARDEARRWQSAAANLERQAADLMRSLVLWQQRAEAAERLAAEAAVRADLADVQAREARRVLDGFHERVWVAFGAGSAGHATLESIRGKAVTGAPGDS